MGTELMKKKMFELITSHVEARFGTQKEAVD
jgi:hypothetical protein